MKSEIRELFSFTASERNGTVVLLILIALLSTFISLQGKFISLPKQNFAAFDAFLDSVESVEKADTSYNEKTRKSKSGTQNFSEDATEHSVYHSKELFNFNPNNLPVEDWVRLGLSPAQARSVKRFETKGGKFSCKEDVKKLFVISEEKYAELEPFIVLPDKNTNDENQSKMMADQKNNNNSTAAIHPPLPEIIELNTADSTLLVSIKGIGPSFAKRILEYREKLGGFIKKEQLKEVYGIDEEKYNTIKDVVKADPSYVRKININFSEAKDFIKLPYISWTVANALVNYRKAHGNYSSVAAIKGCALISEELFQKIQPYLTI
ncbi:hypothetical protein BH09BAC5_BH09BAC5_07560 [soil metagenome]